MEGGIFQAHEPPDPAAPSPMEGAGEAMSGQGWLRGALALSCVGGALALEQGRGILRSCEKRESHVTLRQGSLDRVALSDMRGRG